MPKSDAQLLREYVTRDDEAAFAELVHRHTNLVYSAALRQIESPDAASEITQAVFIGLASGAASLSRRLRPDASIAGWLCRVARNLSLNFRRDAFRRKTREAEAHFKASSIPRFRPYLAGHCFNQPFANGQTEPGAAGEARGSVRAIEAFKNAIDFGRGDTEAAIHNTNGGAV